MTYSPQVSEALTRLRRGAMDIPDRLLALACFRVIEDPRFQNGFGSTSHQPHEHHAYPGGLAVHTAEVLDASLGMAVTMRADAMVLTVAAIWHDYCKILDYDIQDGCAMKTRHHELVRHLAASHAAFMHCMYDLQPAAIADADSRILEVAHCILSHHGRAEWGAAREPKTLEAHILHYADMLSCQFGLGRYLKA